MSDWKKDPIDDVYHGSLTTGFKPTELPIDTVLYQGMGGWTVTKNGDVFYQGEHNQEWDDFKKLSDIEKEARKDPDNDWRAKVFLPLREAEYQRHGKDKWVAISNGKGFA